MGDMMQTEFQHEGYDISSSEIATDVISLKEECTSMSKEDAGTGTALAHIGTDEANIVRPTSCQELRAHAHALDNEQLADFVAKEGWGLLLLKLKELAPYLEVLWERFDNLKKGETIADCRTKKEFCDKCLHRSIRTVQYMLYGRTTKRANNVRPSDQINIDKGETDSEPGSQGTQTDTIIDLQENGEEPSAPESVEPQAISDVACDEQGHLHEAGSSPARSEDDGSTACNRDDERSSHPSASRTAADIPSRELDELRQCINQTADTKKISDALKSFFQGLAQSLLQGHPCLSSPSITVQVSLASTNSVPESSDLEEEAVASTETSHDDPPGDTGEERPPIYQPRQAVPEYTRDGRTVKPGWTCKSQGINWTISQVWDDGTVSLERTDGNGKVKAETATISELRYIVADEC